MPISEERKAYQRTYYENNRERLLAAQRERGRRNYQENPAYYRAKSKKWAAEHPERMRELRRRYSETNAEAMRVKSRAWYAANTQRASVANRKSKLRRYGMTLEEFQAMLMRQGGCCLICQEEMDPPVVDHDHTTGVVRGLLCRPCNAGLGIFRDDYRLLTRATEYLNSSSSGATSTPSSEPLSKPSPPGD